AVPDNGSLPADQYNQHDSVAWLGTSWGVLSGGQTLYLLANAGTGQWSALSSDGAPANTAYNMDRSVLWTGQRLLVRGGGYPVDGWLYRPDTDAWMLTPSENQPPGAGGASMVRVGASTAVWGSRYGETKGGSLWHDDTRTGPLTADLSLTTTLLSQSDYLAQISLVATNAGPEIATGVTLTLTADGPTLVDFENGQPCVRENEVVRCHLDALAPGESREVLARVQLGRGAGMYANASVTSTGPESDPDPTNNARTMSFPLVSISDAEVVEGDSGTKQLTFVATLSQAGTFPVTFDVGFNTGSATAGTDYDATPQPGITIPSGQLSKVISVPVYGDTTVEGTEVFWLKPVNFVASMLEFNANPKGTIVNDDGPVLSIGDASLVEGDSGITNMVFTVTLSQPSTEEVIFGGGYSNFLPGTATVGVDFDGYWSGFGMPPGTTTKQVTVPIRGDTRVEGNEYFYFVIEAGTDNATVGDGIATGTILDNEVPPALSIADVSVNEGDSGTKLMTFTVSMDRTSTAPVTFNATSANG
ncbi:MAG: Calx-beta domain-containing protein, partial [Arenimonas sp.]